MKTLHSYALVPTAILCLYWAWCACGMPLHDFSNYYFSGMFVAEGNFASWAYFPDNFNRAIISTGQKGIFASFAPNTPFIAAVFAALSGFQPIVAKFILNIASILLLLLGIARLAKFYNIRPAFLLLVPIVFFQPLRNGILFGQVYFIVFYLIAEGWILMQKNSARGPFLWALAAILKVFPGLLLLYLIGAKKYREALLMAAISVSLILASMPLTGFESWRFFVTDVMPRASAGDISLLFVDNYNSIEMLLRRMFIRTPLNWGLDMAWLVAAISTALKAFIILYGIFLSRKATLRVYSYWIVSMLLISPYGATYVFVLLLLPLFYFNRIPGWEKWLGIGLIFLICNVPMQIVTSLQFPQSFFRLSLLTILYILFCTKIEFAQRHVLFTASVVVFLIRSVSYQPGKTLVPLLGDNPILVTDFSLNGKLIEFISFDESGLASHEIELNHVPLLNELQLETNKPNIAKTIVVDDTEIILSDHQRGIGFYTLYIRAR